MAENEVSKHHGKIVSRNRFVEYLNNEKFVVAIISLSVKMDAF